LQLLGEKVSQNFTLQTNVTTRSPDEMRSATKK